ncbi:UPSTREAM OF FLC protein (DUF966) isoform X2 [Tasmannia lanceolata]|uniref:UPSTREAM OF FLC protein (DUF966) isoform X2 n=1 Tax=Tasmannia lanceolata TaxID=3420 RepID=UPI00406280DC
MAVSSRGKTELLVGKKWKDRETSPERTKVWVEPKLKVEKKVPVVYYLCKNGNLEHPHFIEVRLSSEGLYLRDVINRLNFLRGKGMASMYSWSSKRSYKNGFVWHDLSENDFIYPVHGHEYILKGSELLQPDSNSRSEEIVSSFNSEKPSEDQKSSEESDFPIIRRRNVSWSSLDLNEYKVYKTESMTENSERAFNASTQTDEKRRRRRTNRDEEEEEAQIPSIIEEVDENSRTELSREEISPPPSSSSPETLESLIKADGRVVNCSISAEEAEIRDHTAINHQSGKISNVLIQLISCGSMSVKENKFSLISHYRARLPSGSSNQGKEIECVMETSNNFKGIQLEDKEYFSGSLIETKKGNGVIGEFSSLKRSSSYNADRKNNLKTPILRAGC